MPHPPHSGREDHLSESRPTPDLPLDAPTADEIDPRDIEIARLQESLEQERRNRRREVLAIREKYLRERCSPLIVDPVKGIHPNEIDLMVGSTPSSLLAKARSVLTAFSGGNPDIPFGFQLALIPVPLYPVPLKGSSFSSGSRTFTNMDLGETRISKSYAVATPLIHGTRTEVSLQAFARVSVNPFVTNPADLHSTLDRSESAARFQLFGVGNPSLDFPDDDGESTFIPSTFASSSPNPDIRRSSTSAGSNPSIDEAIAHLKSLQSP